MRPSFPTLNVTLSSLDFEESMILWGILRDIDHAPPRYLCTLPQSRQETTMVFIFILVLLFFELSVFLHVLQILILILLEILTLFLLAMAMSVVPAF